MTSSEQVRPTISIDEGYAEKEAAAREVARSRYVVRWHDRNGLFRRQCGVCGAGMDKETIIARMYVDWSLEDEQTLPKPGIPGRRTQRGSLDDAPYRDGHPGE